LTKKNTTRIPSSTRLLWPFLSGGFFLALLSSLHKFAVGFDPWTPQSYVLPFVIGSVTGTVLGHYHLKVKKLKERLQQRVDTLERLLPICSHCKKIRKQDADPKKPASWEPIEVYFGEQASSRFSHGICPDCMKLLYGRPAETGHPGDDDPPRDDRQQNGQAGQI
jgi:hypothetical protein